MLLSSCENSETFSQDQKDFLKDGFVIHDIIESENVFIINRSSCSECTFSKISTNRVDLIIITGNPNISFNTRYLTDFGLDAVPILFDSLNVLGESGIALANPCKVAWKNGQFQINELK
ncbi:MAG: hypothetical protein LAT68_00650 [Cyclobacteriaceae bacterium]|nr:hypothetical protein [Cyclobacteriaceae bacterium]MCH8514812.1 hypothetical protein [Cyclobacteriaceae bacterium]